MKKWPNSIPHDLLEDLRQLDGFRNAPSRQDDWVAIREWLVKHGVEAPGGLPTEPERATSLGGQ